MAIVEIWHREIAQKFLQQNEGEDAQEMLSGNLAQLLADYADDVGRKFTKRHLEIEYRLRSQLDAMHALAVRGGNLFAFDLENHVTEVIKAFKTMTDALKASEQSARDVIEGKVCPTCRRGPGYVIGTIDESKVQR